MGEEKIEVQLGVRTWLWESFATTIIERFPVIKKMGYDVVEIPVEDSDLIDVKTVKRALDDHGLKAVLCGHHV